MKTYIFKVMIEEDPFEDGRMAYHAFCPALKGASKGRLTVSFHHPSDTFLPKGLKKIN
ncbi:MAG: hypothetical protein ACE5K3_00560 [bacterium]